MEEGITKIDPESVTTSQPTEDFKLDEPLNSSPVPVQAGGRPNVLRGPLLAAGITSITLVLANAWIVPTVARHQKHIDRMYQAMFDAVSSTGLLSGYTWNVWYERQKLVGATNKPLEDLQQVEAKAQALAYQMPLIFDAHIAAQWNTIVDGYCDPGGVVYPITHRNEFPALATEKEMNEKLNPLIRSTGELVAKMQHAIFEIEHSPWWRVAFFGDT